MRKLSGLIVIAILFSNSSYAEESQGAICENNGGRWLWNGGNNQWYCDKSGYLKRQEPIFERATRECKSGNNEWCGLLGKMYVKGIDNYGNQTPQDIAFGMQLVTKSCKKGDINSCTNLGIFYRDGQYIQGDKLEAARILSAVCNINDNRFGSNSGLACFVLGNMTKNGEGVLKDKYKALELYNKSCALGTSQACDFAQDIKQGI